MAAKKEIANTPEAQQVAKMMERARAAQALINDYSQEQIDELITAMVWAVAKPGVAEKIAQHTLEETQLGNYAGKFAKILSLIHISEPTRRYAISYAVFCLKKKKK